MEAVGIHYIRVYTRRRRATTEEKVSCLHIYEICMEAEQMPGTSRMVRRWYQNAVNEPEEYTRMWCNLT